MKNYTLDCILLIDDNQMTNFIHQTYIEKLGLAKHVLATLGGEEALNLLERLYVKQKTNKKTVVPDLILLDLNMPKMTGYEFLDHYQKIAPLRHHAPIVVVSSSNTKLHINKATKYKNVIDYKVKPIKKEAWLEVMKKVAAV